MRFPKIKSRDGGKAVFKKNLSIDGFKGGVNNNRELIEVDDDQLTDVYNMWWNKGALASRPGFKLKDIYLENGIYSHTVYSDYHGLQYGVKHKSVIRMFDRYFDGEPFRSVYSYSISRESGVYRNQVVGDVSGYDIENACYIENRGGLEKKTDVSDSIIFLAGSPVSNNTQIVTNRNISGWNNAVGDIYIPTISSDGKGCESTAQPNINSKSGEDFNMLTPEFKSLFTTEGGTAFYFYLPIKGLDKEEVTINLISASGTLSSYTIPENSDISNTLSGITFRVNRLAGYFYAYSSSQNPYPIPSAGRTNNLEIVASKRFGGTGEYQKIICGMQYSAWFGGDRSDGSSSARLFLSGNPEYPGRIHWSGAANELYFPHSNFTYIGEAGKPVTALAKQADKLIVFKEEEIYALGYSGQSRTGNRVQFPVTQISTALGCDCPNSIQLCDGRLVWLNSNKAVYTLTNVGSGARVAELSRNISGWFENFDQYILKPALSAVFKGCYLLLIGNEMFVMNFDRKPHESYSRGLISGDKEKISWFKWSCDFGFNFDFLFADDEVILIGGYLYSGTKTLVFNGELSDEFDQIISLDEIESGEYLISEQLIEASFKSKEFVLGGADRVKNIRSVSFELITPQNLVDGDIRFYVGSDGQELEINPILNPVGGNIYRCDIHLSRVNQVYIRAESDGEKSFKIGKIYFDYDIYGKVR